jgi:hypothetical protein
MTDHQRLLRDLKSLKASVALAITMLEGLERVLQVWRGDGAPEIEGRQESDERPVRTSDRGVSEQRGCEACDKPFEPTGRGGVRQRFCGAACRKRAATIRHKAAAAREPVGGSPGAEDGEGRGDTPAEAPSPAHEADIPIGKAARPGRLFWASPDDPGRARFLEPPPLTGVDALDRTAI